MTAATITPTRSRSRPKTGSPTARLAFVLVGLAATAAFTAAGVVLLSLAFTFSVDVPISGGGALGASSQSWWWFDAIGAFLSFAAAISVVVEIVRRFGSPAS